MKISSYQIGTGVVALGDVLPLFKVKVKLGSSEKVSKANSDANFTLWLNNTYDTYPIYIGYDINHAGTFSIAAGGSKTFSYTDIDVAEPDSKVADQSLLDYLKARLEDGGAARKYPARFLTSVYYSGVKSYDAYKNNACHVLLWRLNPEILGHVYTDKRIGNTDQSALDYFGSYVQHESLPVLTFKYQLDPLDETLTSTHILTVKDPDGGEKTYTCDNGVFELDIPELAGEYTWEYDIQDSAGNSSHSNGSFGVIAYTKPEIRLFEVYRYQVGYDEKGNEVYTQSEEGEGGNHVWITARASAYTFPTGLPENKVTVHLEYGIDGNASNIKTIFTDIGQNGITINVTNDRSIVTEEISEANQYGFVLTLFDFFENPSSPTIFVAEAGSDFNIESFGVAVGMRSTGGTRTDGQKLFEVAPTHESYFYGGISGVTNYSTGEVATGGKWIDDSLIYRNTIVFYVDEVNNEKDVVTIDSFGSLISMNGSYHQDNGQWTAVNHYWGDNYYVWAKVLDTGLVKCFNKGRTGTLYLTIEYTKA